MDHTEILCVLPSGPSNYNNVVLCVFLWNSFPPHFPFTRCKHLHDHSSNQQFQCEIQGSSLKRMCHSFMSSSLLLHFTSHQLTNSCAEVSMSQTLQIICEIHVTMVEVLTIPSCCINREPIHFKQLIFNKIPRWTLTEKKFHSFAFFRKKKPKLVIKRVIQLFKGNTNLHFFKYNFK